MPTTPTPDAAAAADSAAEPDSAAAKKRRGARRVEGPTGDRGAEAFSISPFARLARTHAISAGGDALVAIALADSLFFSIDPNDARWQVALYLLLTMAPFAVVAPFLGPAMDRLRGGHRYMMIAAAGVRAFLAAVMVFNVQSLWLFPLAFSMLVMGKTHHVAKSALVPNTVRDEEGLVRANSRLSIISAASAATLGIPGVILLRLGGAPWILGFTALVFAAGVFIGLQMEPIRVASAPAGEEEKAELRGAGIILAASAMGYVRMVVGFLTMLLAFELRGGIDPGPTAAGVELGHRIREAVGGPAIDLASGGAPTWHFGVVLAGMGAGGLTGAMISPRLRLMLAEQRILAGVLAMVSGVAVLALLLGGVIGAALMALAVGMAATTGKQAFDAIVQRDAPEANLARSFSKFESRFQLVWVIGAIIPVVVPLPARLGYVLIAAASAFAAASYWLGRDPSPTHHVDTKKVREAGRRVRRNRRPKRDAAPRSNTDAPPPVSGDQLEPATDPRGR